MCGFVVYLSSGSMPTQENCNQALRSLDHRGPTSRNFIASDGLFVGHTRLAIIDPTPEADQPMSDPSGRYLFVYNGEIYNHLELRRSLKKSGYTFSTTSDTETLFTLILDVGIKRALEMVRGMFAFVLIDQVSRKVWAARDHFGQKPLYWRNVGKSLCISSEILPILSIDETAGHEPNLASFNTYLCTTGIIETSATFFKDINCLRAGCTLTGDVNKLRVTEFFTPLQLFDPGAFLRNQERSKDSLLKELEYLLQQAVRRHLLSDVGIGILLSGGIDSALVHALAFDEGTQLECFTKLTPKEEKVSFQNVPRLLKLRPSPQSRYVEKSSDYIPQLLKLIQQNSAPARFASGPPMYQLCKLAKESSIDVLLSGDTVDEYFGGYYSHTRAFSEFDCDSTPAYFLGDLLTVRRNSPFFLDHRCAGFIEREEAVRKRINEKVAFVRSEQERFAVGTMLHDAATFLQSCNLPHSDAYSMQASVELRNPMLDLDLVEFVLNLPLKWRNLAKPEDPGSNKVLLRELAKKKLGVGYTVGKEGTRNLGTNVTKHLVNQIDEFLISDLLRRNVAKSVPDLSDRDVFRLVNLEYFSRQFFSGEKIECRAVDLIS